MINLEEMQNQAFAELFSMEITHSIDRWYAASPLRVGMPHASAILATDDQFCLRQLVLQALAAEHAERPAAKPWDSKRNAYFLHGWSLHEKYQKLFQSFWQVYEVEQSHYSNEYLLHFTPDAIVNFCGERVIVEIKGYNDEKCQTLARDTQAPLDAHKQANLYMHLLGLQHAFIVVENKNTQAIQVWCVSYSEELALPYLERLAAFKDAYKRADFVGGGSEIPEVLPVRCCTSISDKRAQACPMRTFCFQNNKNHGIVEERFS